VVARGRLVLAILGLSLGESSRSGSVLYADLPLRRIFAFPPDYFLVSGAGNRNRDGSGDRSRASSA